MSRPSDPYRSSSARFPGEKVTAISLRPSPVPKDGLDHFFDFLKYILTPHLGGLFTISKFLSFLQDALASQACDPSVQQRLINRLSSGQFAAFCNNPDEHHISLYRNLPEKAVGVLWNDKWLLFSSHGIAALKLSAGLRGESFSTYRLQFQIDTTPDSPRPPHLFQELRIRSDQYSEDLLVNFLASWAEAWAIPFQVYSDSAELYYQCLPGDSKAHELELNLSTAGLGLCQYNDERWKNMQRFVEGRKELELPALIFGRFRNSSKHLAFDDHSSTAKVSPSDPDQLFLLRSDDTQVVGMAFRGHRFTFAREGAKDMLFVVGWPARGSGGISINLRTKDEKVAYTPDDWPSVLNISPDPKSVFRMYCYIRTIADFWQIPLTREDFSDC